MNKDFQRLLTALEKLTPTELVALLAEITTRLQAHVGEHEEMVVDEPEDTPRRNLPRLAQMISWNVVLPMKDTLYVRDHVDKPALLIDASRVAYQGETMTLNEWARQVTGWKAVNVYEWVMVKRSGRTLHQLRDAYMSENGLES